MPNLTSADIGKVVSFVVYPAGVIPTLFQYVKVLAILDAASTFQWIDPISLHANVYPTLPPGTPNNYKSYTYAKLELSDGTITVVGLPWINIGTIQVHTNTTVRVTVSDVSPDDLIKIRDVLLMQGYNKLNIEFVD